MQCGIAVAKDGVGRFLGTGHDDVSSEWVWE